MTLREARRLVQALHKANCKVVVMVHDPQDDVTEDEWVVRVCTRDGLRVATIYEATADDPQEQA